MKRSAAGTQRTGQPRCAQRDEIATQRLYWVGGVRVDRGVARADVDGALAGLADARARS